MKEKKHYHVVAAVVESQGKVLCVKKGTTRYAYTSHKWEFPGGKIEPGETPEQALQRELREEMCLSVEVKEHLLSTRYEYPDFSITLEAYRCEALNCELMLKEHEQELWLLAHELMTLDWCAADVAIAKEVQKVGF